LGISVVAFAENTDYGIGQAKALATISRRRKRSSLRPSTALASGLHAESWRYAPTADMVATMMLPPAAYIS
jgi:hypothetical protein